MADVDKVKLPDGTIYDVGGGGGSSISPYTSNPAMDGTASPGSSNDYSRGDHVHPHDTSRVPTSRMINGHPLSSNVTLDASDVGALPDTYTAPVSSVNGQTGAVVLDANDVGALPDTTVIPTNTSDLVNDSGFITAASPALTGTPTAPTAPQGTDTTQIATTEFVNDAVSASKLKWVEDASTTDYNVVMNDVDNNVATGDYALAEGAGTTASGDYSHAEGYGTTASGNRSHAEGSDTTASGFQAHSEGQNTTATANWSHAEGYGTHAIEEMAHSEGGETTASGLRSHAEGSGTVASGFASHASGQNTIATKNAQTVIGRYNIEDVSPGDPYGEFAFIVGDGQDENSRSNAFDVSWGGGLGVYGPPAFANSTVRESWVNSLGMGTVTERNGTSTSVPNASDTTLCNSSGLSAGTYILQCMAQFGASSSGRRVLFLATSSTGSNISRYTQIIGAPSPSNYTQMSFTYIVTVTSTTTFYLRAYQNSGGSINVTGGIRVLKLR